MTKDLTPKSLSERIAAQRAEEEAIRASHQKELLQKMKSEYESVESECKSCGSKLRASVRAEAERTRSAIEESLRELRSGIERKLLWSLARGFLFVIGVALGLWGLISFLGQDIEQKIETRRELAVEIEQQRQTVERLRETTWGVVLVEDEQSNRFVVLPEGTLEDPPRYWGGGDVIKLSSE